MIFLLRSFVNFPNFLNDNQSNVGHKPSGLMVRLILGDRPPNLVCESDARRLCAKPSLDQRPYVARLSEKLYFRYMLCLRSNQTQFGLLSAFLNSWLKLYFCSNQPIVLRLSARVFLCLCCNSALTDIIKRVPSNPLARTCTDDRKSILRSSLRTGDNKTR